MNSQFNKRHTGENATMHMECAQKPCTCKDVLINTHNHVQDAHVKDSLVHVHEEQNVKDSHMHLHEEQNVTDSHTIIGIF